MNDPTTPVRDETKVAELKTKFVNVAAWLSRSEDEQGFYRTTFTSIVKEAIAAGATVEEIKQWGAEAKLTPQTVNLALRKAGIRQRSERSDKGKSKSGEPPVVVPEAPTPAPIIVDPPTVLSAEKWAEALLAGLSGDREAAAEFINEMLTYLLK